MNSITDMEHHLKQGTPRVTNDTLQNSLEDIFENTDTCIYSLDRNLHYIAFNSQLKKLVHEWYGLEIKIGDPVHSPLTPPETKEWEKIYQQALEGRSQKLVKKFQQGNQTRYISFSIYPIVKNERVTGLSCCARDVTEQKTAEERLRASEQRYRLVSHNPIIGIVWISPEQKIMMANEAFCRMLGYDLLEVMDSHYCRFIHPDDRQHQTDIQEKLFGGDKDSYRFEKRYLTKQREVIWGELILSTVKDHDGRVKYAIGLVQNITARKNAEAELRSLNESLEIKIKERTAELQEANNELETFSHTVSHDLQTPLRTISGYSNILMHDYSDKLDNEGKRLLNSISKSAAHTGRLVRHLLEFSKLGKTELLKEEVDMQHILQPVLEEIKADKKVANRAIRIGKLGKVWGDPTLMQQVWSNLLWNAVKYTSKEDQPTIEIGMKNIAGEDIYYINDNGVGFDIADTGRLFKAFQRIHNNDEFEGSGLGLVSVHRIITRHGGRIWADAEIGQGACFYFTLPAGGKE